jgi:YbbR domain-containing protein
MVKQPMLERTVLNNLVWFVASLVLAFFVWLIATLQADPIQQRRFASPIEIRLTADEGLLITNPPASNRFASVVIRAPRSTQDLLTSEEISITADLHGLGPGEHTVPLQASVARQPASVVDTSPRLIRITLEAAAQRQVPLRARISQEPPAGYSRDEPVFDLELNQVLVSGTARQVNLVVAVEAEINLRDQRNPVEYDLRLIPIDADGQPVTGVVLNPEIAHVRVNIRRRGDVKEISVTPTITGSLPEGYVLNALSYEPQTILIGGTPSQLGLLSETIRTEAIDLSTHTETFTVAVRPSLPSNDLLLLSGQSINVTIEVVPITASKQFDNIPVEIFGLPENYTAQVTPDRISVLVTGPQSELDRLTQEEIRAAIDLNGLTPGNHTVKPNVSINSAVISGESISALPQELDVEIFDVGVNSATPTPPP